MKAYETENVRLAGENRQLRRENARLRLELESYERLAERYDKLIEWIRDQAPTSSTIPSAKRVIERCVQSALEKGRNVV